MAGRSFLASSLLASTTFIAVTSAGPPAASPQTAPTVQEASAEDAAAQAALEEICGSCHESKLVAGALRTATEWDEVLTRMTQLGANGSDEQFAQIATFLLRNFGKVNVNKGSARDISSVLDVSPAVAEAIVDYRAEHGSFKTIDDLKKVPRVQPEKIEARTKRLTF